MKREETVLTVITSLALLAVDSLTAETSQTNAHNAIEVVLRVQDAEGKPIARVHAFCLPESYYSTNIAPLAVYTNGGGEIVLERASTMVKGFDADTNGVMVIHCRQREMRVELDAGAFETRTIPVESLSLAETNIVTLVRSKGREK